MNDLQLHHIRRVELDWENLNIEVVFMSGARVSTNCSSKEEMQAELLSPEFLSESVHVYLMYGNPDAPPSDFYPPHPLPPIYPAFNLLPYSLIYDPKSII